MTEVQTEDKRLGLKCIGDLALRALLTGVRARCDFCGKRRASVKLSELAEVVEEALRQHCTPYQPSEWDSLDHSLTNFLQMELEIEEEPADELAALLISGDPAHWSHDDEAFFDSDYLYRRSRIYGWEYSEEWEGFCAEIKHRRRFFDTGARERLGRIFAVGDGGLPTFDLGPDGYDGLVSRARLADSPRQAHLIMRNPVAELDRRLRGRHQPDA